MNCYECALTGTEQLIALLIYLLPIVLILGLCAALCELLIAYRCRPPKAVPPGWFAQTRKELADVMKARPAPKASLPTHLEDRSNG